MPEIVWIKKYIMLYYIMEQSEINKDIFYHVNEIPRECSTLRSDKVGGFVSGPRQARLRKSEDFRAVENCLIGRKSHSDCMSAFPKTRHSASCGIPNNTQSNISTNNNKNNLFDKQPQQIQEILDKHETKYNPAIKHGKKVFSPNVKAIVATTYKIPISPVISETYKLNNDLLDIHRNLIETKYMHNINKMYSGGEMKHNTSSTIFPTTILNTELSYNLPSNYLESISISSYIPNTTVTTGYSDSSDLADSSNITTVTTKHSNSSDLSDSSNITTVTTEKK